MDIPGAGMAGMVSTRHTGRALARAPMVIECCFWT